MYGSGSYAQASYASTISEEEIVKSVADSATGNETPLVLLSQSDSATGLEITQFVSEGITRKVTDNATGNETPSLLVLLSQLDSASETSSPAINLSKSDSLVGNSSVTISEGIIRRVTDSATGNSAIIDLLDITNLIVRLDGQKDIEINLEGEMS